MKSPDFSVHRRIALSLLRLSEKLTIILLRASLVGDLGRLKKALIVRIEVDAALNEIQALSPAEE